MRGTAPRAACAVRLIEFRSCRTGAVTFATIELAYWNCKCQFEFKPSSGAAVW